MEEKESAKSGIENTLDRLPLKHREEPSESASRPERKSFWPATLCLYVNTAVVIYLAVYFFIIPFGIILYHLTDPALNEPQIPMYAAWLHRNLSPRYENWAKQRLASDKAKHLDVENVSGTEWPLFGSVFYLWATESLQQTWEQDKTQSSSAPKDYAAGAIEAAAALIADPNQAAWVKKHWGKNYLHKENLFYRMLIISGLTSYQKLLGDTKYFGLLADQVESLSDEIDKSPYGLLDDYPGQCYPTDVAVALAAIKRADGLLGTNHSEFINRSIRGFQGSLIDTYTGLPPYFANAKTGEADGGARGCSTQWILNWAPYLWPEEAKKWYVLYDNYFWQKRYGFYGFREFPKGDPASEWYFDVDSGPVIAGFGVSASAFGIGTARANGRFDHANPLSVEAVAISWPLADGTLVMPRMLSNATDAPYLGEAAMLFALTRMPVQGSEVKISTDFPAFVYAVLGIYLVIGLAAILGAVRNFKYWYAYKETITVPYCQVQFAIWLIILASTVFVGLTYGLAWAILTLLLAQLLPRGKKIRI